LHSANVNLIFEHKIRRFVVRRIILSALPLLLCLAWGLGCGNYDPPPPEERGHPMKDKNKGEKDKKKGALAEP
jgi:hypothetical protein